MPFAAPVLVPVLQGKMFAMKKRAMSLIDLNILFVDNFEKSDLLKHYKEKCITTVTITTKTATNTVINASLFRLSFPLKCY